MANNHTTLASLFSDIADAIRSKTESTAPLVADEFPAAIRALENNKVWAGAISVSRTDKSFSIDCGFKPTYCAGSVHGRKFTGGACSFAFDGVTAWIQGYATEDGDDTPKGRQVSVTVSDTGITFSGWLSDTNFYGDDILAVCVG